MEIKKKEKKEAPPEPEEPKKPEEGFKLRKKSSVPRKETPKKEEEPAAPFAMKLRKASQVKRSWDDDKMETVELKHHEFEKIPQEETPEKSTEVIMSEPIPDKDAIDKDKKKKKKKVKQWFTCSTNQYRNMRYNYRSPREERVTKGMMR